MLYHNILVTGCAGDIGLGIGRILKMSSVSDKVIGCDLNDDHPGIHVFDKCELVQGADSENYLETLKELIEKHLIDIIIPTSEPELRVLLAQGLLETINNIPVVLANKKALIIGFDKLKTADFLRLNGFPYPATKIVKDGVPERFPCIIKSRYGAGSRDVLLVDEGLSGYYSKKRPQDIWQEYLEPNDQEYTCGVYRSKTGETRTIVIKRRLKDGITVYGEVVDNSDINIILTRLADAIDLCGSINVQLRLTNRGPVIFEINPRFSSTVVFRHLLGFEDVIWSLSEKCGAPLKYYKPVTPGTKLYRLSQEVVI